jgi:hypothetical protein
MMTSDPDIDAILAQQNDLLMRWRGFGEELKRRFGPMPIDLALELSDLLNSTVNDLTE